ncbi:hypothetical protein GOV06_02495 [Candidatus Woesearchaeota archaeon]|nr:hypothetical protein [Candidatus Woesearchaeota archaeon]
MASINTIEVVDKQIGESDTISALEEALRDVGIKKAGAFSTSFFTFDMDFDVEGLERTSKLVHHPVTQEALINQRVKREDWGFAIKVDFKPGVTDNSARVLKKDLGLIGVEDADVYTSNVHYITGEFNKSLEDQLERVASNPQIHGITILKRNEFEEQGGFERKIHPVDLGERANMFPIDLGSMDNEELRRTGKLGTLNLDLVKPEMSQKDIDKLRGGTLALVKDNYDLDYMDAIVKYALSELHTKGEGNKKGVITDVGLELLAQMWSEHCRHSLYNASIPGKENGIFQEYIRAPTLEVLKKKPHLGVSIYKDNSGVFKFNDKWLIGLKNETHNSPSALDPYGGSITGIVGVNRDPAGTGLGFEVIGNFLFYFLGHKDDKRKYFKKIITPDDEEWKNVTDKTALDRGFSLEELLLNPKQIFGGVVSGVEEGANQMGIALNLAICQHHENYNGKCQVGVGSWGRAPIEVNGKPTHEKHIDVGDRLYIIGGRAGRDGIHGSTFSSEEYSANSPATAVQIGDPYTQRKMFEALLELRDKGYIKFITDLGAGGVSCASLEMAEETGGLDIDLSKLLVKYEGMTATELFLNESQERMAIAVDMKHKDAIEAIMKEHEVEFSDIGCFTDSGRAIVYANGEKVVDMDMDFINHGFPHRNLKPAEYRLSEQEKDELKYKFNDAVLETLREAGETLEGLIKSDFDAMHRRPNLGSVAGFTDRMDSTVKGLSVQHCIQGKGRVSTKAACTSVELGDIEGLIQSYGHSERQVYIDAEKMGRNAFLRGIGHNVAMGGRMDYMVATDQALWQSSDQPEYQQMLIEANKGMAEVITGCEIPVISGKDSMYNQATMYDKDGNVVKRGVFPTILMTTMAKIDNVDDLVTIDVKEEGNLVYVVGASTKDNLGGSEYHNMYGERVEDDLHIGKVSDEDVSDAFDTFKKINKSNKLLQSAIYIEAGGLAMAARSSAMAGERGIDLNLNRVHQEDNLTWREQMYSETEGRFLVTINAGNKTEFEKIFDEKYSLVGVVGGDSLRISQGTNELISESVDDLLGVYHGKEVKKAA